MYLAKEQTLPQNITTANKVISVDHSNPTSYVAQIELNDEKDGLLYLSQGYDTGWKAYAISNYELRPPKADPPMAEITNFFSKFFPFFFGKELKDHVLVNNWANGWKISNRLSVIGDRSQKEPTTNDRLLITVIFWPQYLEIAGFMILFLTFIFIIVTRWRYSDQ